MAENPAVWGIDIGQAGLKAIRLRYAEAAGQVIAVAFDYVPHPKILSQPDAVPDELIAQALQTFLSRNQIKGDLLAISVPGQTALAKFIQLPPVEAKKVVEIVKYEARQQIPFPLEDVIWDFQTLGSGTEEGGYLLDSEVGLFAMKRDQVMQHLRPFLTARCEVELIQIAPLALYSFLCYDQMGIRSGVEREEGEEASDEYSIVLDMGADTTTLLVTNGVKIWIRNVPIGGNHFTRALTKEMKLTFAKAEHLKCNATKSPDPKAVFQALRPVFNDYVSEIQRSIGFFSSVNRDAKIKKIVGVGNGFKLAGLQKFLHQNLQYEVERAENFSGLVGDAVLNVPLFQENIMTFAVPYGLALQALKLTRIRTSLLPPEIATARMIRRKKPWAVATAAALLTGLGLSAIGAAHVQATTGKDRWGKQEESVSNVVSEAGRLKTEYGDVTKKNEELRKKGEFLIAPSEGKPHWMEVYKAINECLPRDEGDSLDEEDLTKKSRIRIHSITFQQQDDLGAWFKTLPQQAFDYMSEVDKKTPPTGPGYVCTLQGVHYHGRLVDFITSPDYLYPELAKGLQAQLATAATPEQKAELEHQLAEQPRIGFLRNLQQWELLRPGASVPTPVDKIGISHALLSETMLSEREFEPFSNRQRMNRPSGPGEMMRGPGMPRMKTPKSSAKKMEAAPKAAGGEEPATVILKETSFTLMFAWKETPVEKRLAQAPPPPAAAGGPPAPGAPATPPGAPRPPGSPTPPPGTPTPPPGNPMPTPGNPMPAAHSGPPGSTGTPMPTPGNPMPQPGPPPAGK
ncbi:MAG TPA: type IV pilus assembly protein PilM [Planctomycetaceae bacterium]|nr:type IV pilus assembly protein PilM [Planctomycetaceae bacterium]